MTFQELQDQVNALRFRRVIVNHLVEHLDAEFLPNLDQQPKKALLTDEKVRVPVEIFEAVAADLTNWLKSLSAEEQKLLASAITITPPQPPQPPAEQVTPPEKSEVKS